MIRLAVKRLFSFLIFLLVLYAGIGSQEVGGGFSDAPEVPGSEADVPAPQPLPRSFGSMVLGISLEQAKEDLQTDSLFSYRGDPDISFSPVDSQPIIRADGLAYLDAGIFQFHEDALYSITLQIDPEQLDYFTMYSTLTAKYGDPDYLDPQQSYWERNGVRMILEKPVTVKYLDMDAFTAIREAGAAQESVGDLSREIFLDNF
jgi:hypothetical protein